MNIKEKTFQKQFMEQEHHMADWLARTSNDRHLDIDAGLENMFNTMLEAVRNNQEPSYQLKAHQTKTGTAETYKLGGNK